MKVHIDHDRCQGHGRCYDLAPQLFAEDDEGYGQVVGTGDVGGDAERLARLAVGNCPESAIDLVEEA